MRRKTLLILVMAVLVVVGVTGLFLVFGANKIGIKRSWQLVRIAFDFRKSERQSFDKIKVGFESGLLTGVVTDMEQGDIWLWNMRGEKRLRFSASAEFLYHDICNPAYDSQGSASLVLEKEAWLRAANNGYVQVWLEGYQGQQKLITRGIAFSGYPFVQDRRLRCN